MDIPENIQQNLPFIIGAIALVVFQFIMRKRRGPGGNQQEIVQNLLAEVRLNVRLAELLAVQYQPRKFMMTSWVLSKNQVVFLPSSLQTSLADAFMMAEDFNRQIDAAKKYKSTSYMASVDLEKLKKLFVACQEGLELWLVEKTGTKNPPEKIPGMFDDLLGRR